jgi:mercuric ion transport protein
MNDSSINSTKRVGTEDCDACRSPYDGRSKGYVYAVLTAIACPCHLPIVGIVLGGSAAGVMFYEYFWPLAIFFGALSLFFFAKAARILL